MKLVKCAKGHYYDKSIYSSCPYCEGADGRFEDEGVTVGYSDYADSEVTVAFNGLGTEKDREKAGGVFNPVVGWLVCVEGEEKGRDYRIVSGRNYVGRSADNNICIADDDSISRERHFCIVYDPRSRHYFALPGESSSIQINGEVKYNKHLLSDGDMIVCGKSKLCFIGFCKEGRDWT